MNCLNCKVSCQDDCCINENVTILFPKKNKKLPQKTPLNEPNNLESAAFMRYIQDFGLSKIFDTLPDPRKASYCNYSISSLAMWAFCTCAFRQGSKNAMQTSIESIADPEHKEGLLHLLNIKAEQKSIPHSSVVDDALSRIDHNEFNNVLLKMFDRLNDQKVFYHNQGTLLPYNTFQIGMDGFWIQYYTEAHAKDSEGNNICPHCLPRVHNKGKPNQHTTYVHVMVTCVLICGGVTLPFYVYPLKNNQVQENQSDEALKEQCELVAAYEILPLLRNRYPKLDFTFLGDSLYANQQFVRLCNKLKIDYVIVVKEGAQKNLYRRCDKLEQTELYKNNYTHQETEQTGNKTITRNAAWFNTVEMGEVFTNVLRFKENVVHSDGTSEIRYKGAWICSKKIFQNNCFKRARQGRSRWDHEDTHNTLKRRGYDIKHDMARSNPNLLIVWKIMMFIALFLTELFMNTVIAQGLQKTRSCMKFAKDILQQLIERSWKVISMSPIWIKSRVQFRFNFSP